MIKVHEVDFKLGKKSILKKVSATFQPNEITMVIGPNGAGKSSLLKVLSQQITPNHGAVYFEEKSLMSYNVLDMAKIRAVLSQHLSVAFPLTVLEVVMMGRYPHFEGQPRTIDHKIVDIALELFDMTAFSDRNFQTLSGGEQQRVHFARVTSQIWPEDSITKYLFLDEPLTYLDVYYQYGFMDFLTRFMRQQPIVVVGVVHDLNMAYKYGHQIVLMDQGQVTKQGDAKEVFTSLEMELAFKLKPTIYTSEDGSEVFSFS